MVTLTDARRIITAAERKAEEIGQSMNIGGGRRRRKPGRPCTHGQGVDRKHRHCINKAWTARAFDIETKQLAELSQSGDQFFGIHASNHGRVMIFAGGIPFKRADVVVGAAGVSGGTGKQDQAVAEAGAAEFQR